jgi:hypothetical protein
MTHSESRAARSGGQTGELRRAPAAHLFAAVGDLLLGMIFFQEDREESELEFV